MVVVILDIEYCCVSHCLLCPILSDLYLQLTINTYKLGHVLF